jgi:hypothetical protein
MAGVLSSHFERRIVSGIVAFQGIWRGLAGFYGAIGAAAHGNLVDIPGCDTRVGHKDIWIAGLQRGLARRFLNAGSALHRRPGDFVYCPTLVPFSLSLKLGAIALPCFPSVLSRSRTSPALGHLSFFPSLFASFRYPANMHPGKREGGCFVCFGAGGGVCGGGGRAEICLWVWS